MVGVLVWLYSYFCDTTIFPPFLLYCTFAFLCVLQKKVPIISSSSWSQEANNNLPMSRDEVHWSLKAKVKQFHLNQLATQFVWLTAAGQLRIIATRGSTVYLKVVHGNQEEVTAAVEFHCMSLHSNWTYLRHCSKGSSVPSSRPTGMPIAYTVAPPRILHDEHFIMLRK